MGSMSARFGLTANSYMFVIVFSTQRKVLCLGCLDVDPLYDTFIPLFVCVLTPVWEGDMHNFLLVARAASY